MQHGPLVLADLIHVEDYDHHPLQSLEAMHCRKEQRPRPLWYAGGCIDKLVACDFLQPGNQCVLAPPGRKNHNVIGSHVAVDKTTDGPLKFLQAVALIGIGDELALKALSGTGDR